jgi:hypothetical protein
VIGSAPTLLQLPAVEGEDLPCRLPAREVYSMIVPLTQAVWATMVTIIVSLAEDVGGNTIAQRFMQLLTHRKLAAAITEAIERAYQRFEQEARDPEFVAALRHNTSFASNPEVVAILARAATQPQFEENQILALANQMQAIAPQISLQRCQQGAKLLIRAVHTEVSTIKQLQDGLVILRTGKILAEVERLSPPEYVPALREAVLEEAETVERKLGHGYITAGHILYALMVVPACGAAKQTLEQLHVTAEGVKAALVECIKPQDKHNEPTQGALQAMSEAQQVARRLHDFQTRDTHLLVALAQQVAQHESKSLIALFKMLELSAEEVQASALRAGQVESQIESALQSFIS